MAVAAKMNQFMEKSSWIRKMFEEGARLKKIHGADKVFDFSLGNPNLPPPDIVREKLIELAGNVEAQVLGVPTGGQDYYSAVKGGVQAIRMGPFGVLPERLALRQKSGRR